MTVTDLRQRLLDEGARRYHEHHPFNKAMHAGELSREALRRWVVNRWYYQTRIPIKDALILSKAESPEFRRMWRQRLVDHDGQGEDDGGLAEWIKLAAAFGVTRTELVSCREVLPGVRFACDAYVELVRRASLVEAVAASLTEHFAPGIMAARIAAWERHYDFIPREALEYFRSRIPRATRDGDQAMAYVLEHATTPEVAERCVAALITKTEVLWHLLDCVAVGP